MAADCAWVLYIYIIISSLELLLDSSTIGFCAWTDLFHVAGFVSHDLSIAH